MTEPKKFKQGNFSKEEVAYITANYNTLSFDKMGEFLNRRPDTIKNFVLRNKFKLEDPTKQESVQQAIHKTHLSMAWKKLRQQLDEDEFIYAQEIYANLVAQFKEDVYKTEESQIIKLILFEIFMGRNAVERKEIRDDLKRSKRTRDDLQSQIDNPKKGQDDSILLARLENVNTKINELMAVEKSLGEEFVKYEKPHQELMKGLKGTREQRIKNIESRKSFLDIIKSLDSEEYTEKEGRQQELMRIATERELERLSKPHSFANKEIDLPILSVETIEQNEKKDGESS